MLLLHLISGIELFKIHPMSMSRRFGRNAFQPNSSVSDLTTAIGCNAFCGRSMLTAYTYPGFALELPDTGSYLQMKRKNENRIYIKEMFCIFGSGKWFTFMNVFPHSVFASFKTKVVDPDLDSIRI
jgi:hypothetical protein